MLSTNFSIPFLCHIITTTERKEFLFYPIKYHGNKDVLYSANLINPKSDQNVTKKFNPKDKQQLLIAFLIKIRHFSLRLKQKTKNEN